MVTLLSLLGVALLVLAAHEAGHYLAARWCGVRVIRVCIGVGPVVWSRASPARNGGRGAIFEWRLLPVTAHTEMLDDLTAPVHPSRRAQALCGQSLPRRAAIALAGPLASVLLAVGIYAALHWSGVRQHEPLLAPPAAGTIAHDAGLRGGERVRAGAVVGGALAPLATMDQLHWLLTQAALERRDVRLLVTAPGRAPQFEVLVPLAAAVQAPGAFDRLGLQLDRAATPLIERYGLVPGLWRAAERAAANAVLMVRALVAAATNRPALNLLWGNVQDAAAQTWLVQVALFAAMVTLAVALENLLPWPMADGGQLVYIVREAITGRPVPPATRLRLVRCGSVAYLILGLGLFALA